MESEIKKPLISIIIATYNAAAFLQHCMDSIAAQSFSSIEVIIIDGGSNDETIKIVNAFSAKPLQYISAPDKGIYDALNKGCKMAAGKWLYFMGADDQLLPGFSVLASKMNDENTVYYGDSEPFHYSPDPVDFELLTGQFSTYRLAKHCMNHQVILYPAAVFQKYHYDLKYRVFADYALNIRVWGDSHFQKKHFPILIAKYNVTGFSSQNKDEVFEKEKPQIVKESMGVAVYLRLRFKKWKKKYLEKN